MNRKYHDLKHQIALLRSQGNEERNGVLDQMESEIQSYEALNVTGNKVLDTVLTSKSLHCQSQGIQMTCVADGHALDFLSAMDISSLFGNALDNAIESVGKIRAISECRPRQASHPPGGVPAEGLPLHQDRELLRG